MNETKKRVRTCGKYHFDTVQICRETDCVFTRCRVCGERKPSNLDYFMKETHSGKKREIQPLCKECSREQHKQRNEKYRSKQQPTIKVEAHSLFEKPEEETVESKLDKVIAFLSRFGLK